MGNSREAKRRGLASDGETSGTKFCGQKYCGQAGLSFVVKFCGQTGSLSGIDFPLFIIHNLQNLSS